MKKYLLSTGLALVAGTTFAQWSTDLKTNLPISDYNLGNASCAHAAATPDGKFWVTWLAWEDNMNGHIKAQLLDADGKALLDPDGVYVSNQITATYHTNYGMAVAPNGDLVVCHCDSRNDPERHAFDPYIYRMNQDGDMLWGLGGVKLPTTASYGGKPYVAISGDGTTMVGYNDVNEPYMTFVLMKVNEDGTLAWDAPVKTDGAMGTVMSGGEDEFYVTVLGNGLKLMKYDSLGDQVWDPITICSKDMNTYSPYPAYADGKGGVVVPYFYYVSLSIFNNGLQHVTADGEATMGLSGMDIVQNMGLNYCPGVAINGNREEVTAYWQQDLGNYTIKLMAQKFDFNGTPIWDEPLQIGDTHTHYGFLPAEGTMLDDGSTIMFYGDFTGAIKLNLTVEKLDPDGNSVWRTQIAPTAFTDAPVAIYEGDNGYFFWNDNRNVEVASVSNPYGCVFGQYLNLDNGTPDYTDGVSAVNADTDGCSLTFADGSLQADAPDAGTLDVYTPDGAKVASFSLQTGHNSCSLTLSEGVYVARMTTPAGTSVIKFKF